MCALNCDRCGDETAWKCIDCLDMSEELYEALKSTPALQWFCEDCKGKVLATDEVSGQESVSEMFHKIMEKMIILKNALSDKADIKRLWSL